MSFVPPDGRFKLMTYHAEGGQVRIRAKIALRANIAGLCLRGGGSMNGLALAQRQGCVLGWMNSGSNALF